MSNAGSPQFIIEGDSGSLFRRLQKGQIVRARIIMQITDEKYLMRIQGHNLIMRSQRKFEKFQELDVEVKAKNPYLVLNIVDPGKTGAASQSGIEGRTNIVI